MNKNLTKKELDNTVGENGFELCVWHNIDIEPDKFEDLFESKYNSTVIFLDKVYNKEYKCKDIIFAIEYEGDKTTDLKKEIGFRWFMDIYFNNQEHKFYSKRVLSQYPDYSELCPFTVKDLLNYVENDK